MKITCLISLAFVISGTVAIESFFDTLKTENANIEWADTLSCGGCARGGYQYCKYDNTEGKKEICEKEKDPK